jgi:hypothetical protein
MKKFRRHNTLIILNTWAEAGQSEAQADETKNTRIEVSLYFEHHSTRAVKRMNRNAYDSNPQDVSCAAKKKLAREAEKGDKNYDKKSFSRYS